MFKPTVALSISLVLFAAACSNSPNGDASDDEGALRHAQPSEAVDAGSDAAAGAPMPDSLHWFRNSAEYQAGARQAFGLAASVLAGKVAARDPNSAKPWAVIVDCDETMLDNSQFQLEGWKLNVGYSPERWSAWVAKKAAPAVPGAAKFSQKVHDLGGKLVLVTNRAGGVDCDATELNLRAQGIAYDGIFCQAAGAPSDKNARFAAVQDGTANPGALPALDVLMFVGDNILDFPGQSQAIRTGGDAAFVDFGDRFITIPNPMYGSWQKNPAE